ncbi:MAG: phage portal protein [Propionibacteriaceae bacterium]|jgi:hypothetical protein|nr:phage portal protein [Propionibacteriaceae bacterium]
MSLDSAETAVLKRLTDQLAAHERSNQVKAEFYDGTHRPAFKVISSPDQMRGLSTRVGWAGIVVDSLEERLDFQGWRDPAGLGLDRVYRDNHLDVEAGLGHLDALIYGIAFVTIGVGDDDEPPVIVKMASPRSTTGLWNARARRLEAAATIVPTRRDETPRAALYLPDQTIRLAKTGQGGPWLEEDRDRHRLGRVPVIQLANRTRASRLDGRSEITPPIRDLCDEASRILQSMAVARECYSAPHFWALNVNPEDFADKGWDFQMGRILAYQGAIQGPEPKLGEFKAASPQPYVERLAALGQQVCAEAGLPSVYLGAAADTANPASADAIRAAETRLIKRAERRQAQFGMAWLEVADLALRLANGGDLPPGADQIACLWGDAAAPTAAAQADEAAKLVGAGILPPQSRITLARLGFTPDEQDQIIADWQANPAPTAALAAALAPDRGDR